MNWWEALTAISSAITMIVLIATVVMARRQVQLLRRSTQLDGLMKVLAKLNEPRYDVYCQAGAPAVRAWHALAEVIRRDRAHGGPGMWDGFELLVNGTTRYYRTMNPNFPEPYSSPRSSASDVE